MEEFTSTKEALWERKNSTGLISKQLNEEEHKGF